MRRLSAFIAVCVIALGAAIVSAPMASAATTDPASLYYSAVASCSAGPSGNYTGKCWTDSNGTAITGNLIRRAGDDVRIYNQSGATIYISSAGLQSGWTALAAGANATFSIGGSVNYVDAYDGPTFGSSQLVARIATSTPNDVTVTGTNSATTLSVSSLDVAVGYVMQVRNNGSTAMSVLNGTGGVTAGGPSGCVAGAMMPCEINPSSTGMLTVTALGTITIGSATLTIGAAPTPTPAAEKPGTPGKPTAVAGVGAATVSVVAPTTGSAVVTYTVTSSPDAKTCTVTVPATSCEVSGLTNGTAYTFTSTATNSSGTSDASAASDAVTPNLKPNTPATPPAYAKTSSIAHPGVSVLLKKAVVTPSGATATPRVRFVEYVQGLRPHGDTGPVATKLGTYKVTKSGKVIVDVKSKQPMTIIMTLRAPATAEYAAYKSVKTWVLK